MNIDKKIVDDLVANKDKNKNKPNSRRGPASVVVDQLTSFRHKIPVCVLAMYPDGTCDVEVGQEFIAKWSKSARRRFCIPGQLHKDGLNLRDRQNKKTPRYVLQKVPQIYLKAHMISYGSFCLPDDLHSI